MRYSDAGRKRRGLAEDVRIGMKADGGAAPVVHRTPVLQRTGRRSADIGLRPQEAIARDLDGQLSDRALTTEMPTPCRPPEV